MLGSNIPQPRAGSLDCNTDRTMSEGSLLQFAEDSRDFRDIGVFGIRAYGLLGLEGFWGGVQDRVRGLRVLAPEGFAGVSGGSNLRVFVRG